MSSLLLVVLVFCLLVVLVAHEEDAQSHSQHKEDDPVAWRAVEPGQERGHRAADTPGLGALTTGHGS